MIKQVNPSLFFFSSIPHYEEIFLGHEKLEWSPEPAQADPGILADGLKRQRQEGKK